MDPTTRATVEIIAAATVPITILAVSILCLRRRIEMGYRAFLILEIGAVLPVVLILALEGLYPSNTAAAILGGVAGYILANALKDPSKADKS